MHIKLLSVGAILFVICSIAMFIFLFFRNTPEISMQDHLKYELDSLRAGVDLYLAMAECDFKRQDISDMADSYNTCRIHNMECLSTIWFLEGIQSAEMGKYKRALHAADQALEYRPGHIDTFALKVYCHNALNMTNQISILYKWYQSNRENMNPLEISKLNTAFGINTVKNDEVDQKDQDPFELWLQKRRPQNALRMLHSNIDIQHSTNSTSNAENGGAQ